MKTSIWITTEKENYHAWLTAPDEVNFLRNNHRHIFKFRVSVYVDHDDRDIEFFIFKRHIDKIISNTEEWKNKSCEMICGWLYTELQDFNIKSIEVSEDGENGATLEI